jgi:CheY-like chemotaxis protein
VGPVSQRVKDYLTMLDGDCKRLLGTVNDILDIRKVEDDSLELDRSKLPLVPLVRDCAESLEVQARRKGIVIERDLGAGRWFVDADVRRIERVLLNVLGNAVKFTPDGGSVHVSLGDDPERDRHVRVQVRDTGIGIPPEAISKVTLRYFTVGEQPSGSGLGLAISNEIIEMHGGHLEIESPPAGYSTGTRVSISLPLTGAPRVLVVDADSGVCDLLRQHVERHGYRLSRSAPGEEAFTKIEAIQPDVLVVDMREDEPVGMELLMRVGASDERRPAALIAVTSDAPGHAREEILKALGVAILQMPLNGARVAEQISEMFLGSGATVGLSGQPPDAEQ